MQQHIPLCFLCKYFYRDCVYLLINEWWQMFFSTHYKSSQGAMLLWMLPLKLDCTRKLDPDREGTGDSTATVCPITGASADLWL